MSAEPLDWTEDGPRSLRFDDVYFSRVDGLAESRSVFLAGCGLPEAWVGRSRFTVAELGFGTGLNVLALLDLWRRTREPGQRLHVFSIEAYPIGRDDAARALAAWPDLADLAATLLAAWPDGRRGWRRIDFPAEGAILDLAITEAAEALAGWDGRADAWFLDGFAPSRNPEMWRPELLSLVAARSAPAARAASFTVAGSVRRGLEAVGFAIEKHPGFGRKRERLEARRPGALVEPPGPGWIAIVGAGIAGAALARAFTVLGAEPVVVERAGFGSGASGAPAALVSPRLDAGLGPVAALHAQAFDRAVQLYRAEAPGAILAEGALQLAQTSRDQGRFERLVGWDGFAPGALDALDAAAASARLGEAAPPALLIRDALTIAPAAILEAWLRRALWIAGEVATVEPIDTGWRLCDAAGATLVEADIVCLAAGPATAFLDALPLRPVRGQVSTSATPFPGAAAAWGGYAIATRDGLLFGATHDRGDSRADVRPEDHVRNLAGLTRARPELAAALDPAALAGWAAVRAATPDHLPLAGAVPGRPGLFVLAGLGGRGFTLAPLLAEAVAATALGAPPALPRALAEIVDADRYVGRSGEVGADHGS